MLKNFFRLNDQFEELTSAEALHAQLKISKHLANLLYRPDLWAPSRPSNRIEGITFENVSFAKTKLRDLELRDCTFQDCLFIGTVFESCEVHGCRFYGCNPHKIDFRDTYIDPSSFVGLLDKQQHANIGVHLFQNLYRNASATYQKDFAQTAEFHFRIWRRSLWNWERRNGKLSKREWFWRWAPDAAFHYFAGYGLRARYFAAWTVVVLGAVIAFNYSQWERLGMLNVVGEVSGPRAVDAFYFSIVTLSTIGFGDLVASSPFGRTAIAVQGLIGLLWLGTLAGTIIKRLVR